MMRLCEDNLDPRLDQGSEEVIRVTLLTLVLTKLRANRLLNIINLILRSDFTLTAV